MHGRTPWNWAAILPVALGLLLAVGCARPVRHAAANPMEIDPREYDRLFEAGIVVLREHGFRVDRRDHRFGVITSRPGPTQFATVPSNGPRSTMNQRAEDLLNRQRRLVRITLSPLADSPMPLADQPRPLANDPPHDAAPRSREDSPHPPAIPPAGLYQLAVEVTVQRLTVPARYLSGSTVGYAGMGSLTAPPGELSDRGIDGSYWVDLGRDPHLEQRLLAAIVRRSIAVR